MVERGGSVATAVPGDVEGKRGLGLRAAFSSMPVAPRLARSWSNMSVVLAVLRFVPV